MWNVRFKGFLSFSSLSIINTIYYIFRIAFCIKFALIKSGFKFCTFRIWIELFLIYELFNTSESQNFICENISCDGPEIQKIRWYSFGGIYDFELPLDDVWLAFNLREIRIFCFGACKVVIVCRKDSMRELYWSSKSLITIVLPLDVILLALSFFCCK